ncbi:hypothetical protein EST38_g476 [Candolleomyces aberdarensis]|uniref:Uncharacterized protein n=1 Tax=Candolleomyces aberdarensis TaxID=2316362 RepID=A0A4Q2DYG5_9AGAR|nr:hypothetical protein EST38_g476 [Candolleomyces aberdarensis]
MKKPNEQLPLSPEQRRSTVKDLVNKLKATRSVGDTMGDGGGMQQPTHPRLHVRDALDAHVVFEAVRLGHLRPVMRRLNDVERSTHVHSGAIFVWIESEDDAGLKRWTDGRVWGQGRMREPYLFYEERLPCDTGDLYSEASRAPRLKIFDGVSNAGPSPSALSHQERSTKLHQGLVKQCYSAWVSPNPYARPQKWHLTTYFTYADLPQLPTIDQDKLLATIVLPEEVYKGGGSGKARSREHEEVSKLRTSPAFSSSTLSSPSSESFMGSHLPPLVTAAPHGWFSQPRA